MTRAAQNFLLLLLGGAVLWITLGTGEFTNYVKPGLEVPLVGSAVLLLGLGLAGLRRDWNDRAEGHDEAVPIEVGAVPVAAARREHPAGGTVAVDEIGHDDGHPGRHGAVIAHRPDGEGHGHGPVGGEYGHVHKHGGPLVAWLLCLPVLGIFAIAPPELGAFTADRNSSATRNIAPPASVDDTLPAGTEPLKMSVSEFVGRSFEAQIGGSPTLKDRTVRLIGFAAPRKQGHWYLTRLQMSCCAADTIALQVIVLDAPSPAKGAWVEVTGVWKAPSAKESGTGVHYIAASGVTPATKPGHPYE